MENIKVIGERSSIFTKDNVFSLVILPTGDKKKTNLMFLWLFAWSVSGAIIIANYFTLSSQSTKLFVIIWIAFWAYFEFKIARVFMWKRFGKEKLWIKNGTLFYKQDINGRGKTKEYDLNLITDLELIPVEASNFADMFNQTFWVKGGERICFTIQSKIVRFGLQLSDDDAKKIIAELKKQLK
jgi:hypothetical protein